ncbi:MAG: M20/M25/M40 family metallo-hydrolase [Trebonia sp.]
MRWKPATTATSSRAFSTRPDLTAELGPMSYWADSAFVAAAGIPTVLYGPEGDGAHADIEWVSINGTKTVADVLTRLAQQFC